MKLREIVEEFEKSVKLNTMKGDSKIYEIFRNPTKKELKEVQDHAKQVRFIADSVTKDIYVFNPSMLHSPAARNLNIPYEEYSDRFLFGIGKNFMGKIMADIVITSGSSKLKQEIEDENPFDNLRFD